MSLIVWYTQRAPEQQRLHRETLFQTKQTTTTTWAQFQVMVAQTVNNSSFRGPNALFYPPWTPGMHVVYTDLHSSKIPIHIK